MPLQGHAQPHRERLRFAAAAATHACTYRLVHEAVELILFSVCGQQVRQHNHLQAGGSMWRISGSVRGMA